MSLNDGNEKLRDDLKSKAKENQDLQEKIEASRNEIICNYEVRNAWAQMLWESQTVFNDIWLL